MTLAHLMLDCGDAWAGLRRRALRSLLSGLGIGIGVTALVAMLSIGEGAKHKALAKIASLGVNTIRIESNPVDNSRRNLSSGLNREDAEQIRTWLGSRGSLGAYARQDALSVFAGQRTHAATLLGISPDWAATEQLTLSWGRPLLAEDDQRQARVCLLGTHVAQQLQIATHAMIDLRGEPCTVIGVLAPKGRLLTEGSGLSALDFDDSIVMPLNAFPFSRESAGRKQLDGLVVALDDGAVLSAAKHLDAMLLQRHRGVRDFQLVVPLKLLQEVRDTQSLFALVMGSIAGLSLLVGGIGIMNIMLANISEQTHEIGLRMALGASPQRIVVLYLWHAVLLTLLGGLWGIPGGMLVAFVIQAYAGWEVAFSSLSLILGPVSAVLIGVGFGLHPALRAAALQPARALREV